MSTSYHGEIKGIHLATQFAVQTENPSIKHLRIMCDCRSAIQSVCSVEPHKCHHSLIQEIQKDSTLLFARGIKTKIVWVPGHADLDGNELADVNAKKAAKTTDNNLQEIPVTLNKVKRLTRGKLLTRWQRIWDRSETGRDLHQMRPKIPTKPYQSKWRKSLEKKYMRLCSGHYNLRAHMHKLKLSDTPMCECGQDREDASHVLMHCSRYQQQREVMIDNIERLYIRHNTPFHERHQPYHLCYPSKPRSQILINERRYQRGSGRFHCCHKL